MIYRIFIVFGILVSLFWAGKLLADEMTIAWLGCDGTLVSRVNVGKFEILHTEKNQPGCLWPKATDSTGSIMNWGFVSSGTTLTGELLSTEIDATSTGELVESMVFDWYDPEVDGPLFDLAQTDIVRYRTELMKARQIRYVNALRSVRMRAQASKNSNTEAYLMRNDAVIMTQSGTGWTGVQGWTISVTDTGANLIEADTTGKADGYIATKYLRDPNTSDLVRIKQADQQFWSDIARVNVNHSVNVRAHPWYGSKILFVLTNTTPLYVVSTIDNWSEVISDDRVIHWYIRSDYITIEKHQRKEIEPLLR